MCLHRNFFDFLEKLKHMTQFPQKNHKILLQSRQGFALIEILVSLFIFTLLMVTTSQVFASAFSGYQATRAIQRDVENAQFAISILVKQLRTSSIVSGSATRSTYVQFFDYSQNRCFHYRISNGALETSQISVSDRAACYSLNFLSATFSAVTTGTVSGFFQATPSNPAGPEVGKVTISLDIQEGIHHVQIQTSTSLRDYGYVGL